MKSIHLVLAAALLGVMFVGPEAVPAQGVAQLRPAGYQDVGWDPADVPRHPAYDLRQTARRVFQASGSRFIAVSVRGAVDYAQVDWMSVVARLDTRRGPASDIRIGFSLGDLGSGSGDACWVAPRGEKPARAHLRVLESGAMTCRVPATDLRITHRVRWRLVSYYEPSPRLANRYDRAPDRGWYS